MATISRGFTFTDGSLLQCSYTALHALVDAGTVTAIALSEFAPTTRPTQVSAGTPTTDQGDGSLWVDTTNNQLKLKALAGYQVEDIGPSMTNSTGATIERGAWVNVSAAQSIAKGATFKWTGIVGAMLASCPTATAGIVQTTGMAPAMIAGPVTIGDVLVLCGNWTSGMSGAAMSLHLAGMTLTTMGVEVGMALGAIAGNVTGLVTCMIFG